MPDGKTLKGQARVPLGIVVERRAIDNPWIDYRWKAVGVIPGAAPLLPQDDWTLLGSGEDWVQYHAGTLALELFPRETEGYKLNLSQSPPRLFVVLRSVEDDECAHEVVPFLVTACPYEAQDYLDSGEELVEAIAMPEGLIAFVQSYIDEHHVDEPFKKRKRERAGSADDAFARPPVTGRGRSGNGRHG